jgi:hypothetical protein
MSVLKKRGVATAISAVLILLSILLGARKSLMNLYNDVSGVFEHGVQNDGFGIRYDLNAKAAYAYNLTTVAKRYMPENHTKITALETAADKLRAAGSVSEAYRLNGELSVAARSLYDALGTYDLSDKDKSYRESIMTDLESSEYKISHSEYNRIASEYNRTLDKFPASLFRIICSVEKAELFGE